MRMKLYTLLCISFSLLFTACNQDDDPVPPEVGSRTVLVYIVADNNLSSFAKEDVEEMIAGMESVDLSSSNLLVYQDDRVAPVLFRISRNKKGRLEKEDNQGICRAGIYEGLCDEGGNAPCFL